MNGPLLRLLDANANRAREGLRVVEDYARFVLNDDGLCAELKRIRHELGEAVGPFVRRATLYRDTPGDVGTGNKTSTEFQRADVAAVVTAAGKRLGEALRALEEFAKVDYPESAAKIEKLRYGFYDVEQRLAFSLRPAGKFACVRLCVLVTESVCKRHWLEAAEQAILGGADCLQLREKELEGGELLRRAKDLIALCRKQRVVSIVNDRADIAYLSDADGVHVGQGDLPAREARKIVGVDKIVGVSTHCLEQARQAVADGADYVGVGPIFKSGTKPRDFVAGLTYAREVAENIPIPALAIAGITPGNVDEAIATGIGGIAVTAAVVGCDDPLGAAKHFKEKLTRR